MSVRDDWLKCQTMESAIEIEIGRFVAHSVGVSALPDNIQQRVGEGYRAPKMSLVDSPSKNKKKNWIEGAQQTYNLYIHKVKKKPT